MIGVAALLMGGCSFERAEPGSSAQSGALPGAVGAGGAGANLGTDEDFVRDVVLENMTEVELSRMALNASTDPAIKAFAQRLIDDHSDAAAKLKTSLAGKPIEWPGELDEKHRRTADELGEKHAADFDRDYVKAMVEGHQDLAAKLESRIDLQSLADWKTAVAARTQSNAMPEPATAMSDVAVRPAKSGNETTMSINQWAADTYPVAQKHLDAARALETAAKKSSTD